MLALNSLLWFICHKNQKTNQPVQAWCIVWFTNISINLKKIFFFFKLKIILAMNQFQTMQSLYLWKSIRNFFFQNAPYSLNSFISSKSNKPEWIHYLCSNSLVEKIMNAKNIQILMIFFSHRNRVNNRGKFWLISQSNKFLDLQLNLMISWTMMENVIEIHGELLEILREPTNMGD